MNSADVDGNDFLIWQPALGVDDSGDANGDGVTDVNDFLIWQTKYAAGGGSVSAAVPEPASMALVVAVAVAGMFLLRQGKS